MLSFCIHFLETLALSVPMGDKSSSRKIATNNLGIIPKKGQV